MDFNEINRVNLNKIFLPQKGKNKPAKENPKQQKEALKQTPNNPSYWQSAIGVKNSTVSFSGNSENSNELIDKQIAKIKNVCYWGNENKINENFHRQVMQELLPKGEQVVEKYVEYACYGIKDFWNEHDLERYNRGLAKLFSEVPSIEELETSSLHQTIYHITNYAKETEDFDKYINIFSNLLNNQNGDLSDKQNWMEKIISHKYRENHPQIQESEEVTSEFETYVKLCDLVGNDEAKKDILDSKLTVYDYALLINLLADENLQTDRFVKFVTDNMANDYWNKNADETLISVINDISTDKKKKEVFAKLIDKKISYMKVPAVLVQQLLQKDLNFLSDTLDYFKQRIKDENSACPIPTFTGISDFFDVVNQSNIESFKEFSEGMELADAFENIKLYINPKTNLFDYKIAEKQNEFEERGISCWYSLETAKNCIDLETGEFSKIALDVIDLLFPMKESSFKGKLKTIKNTIKAPSKLRLPYNFDEQNEILNAIKNNDGNFEKENKDFLFSILKANKKRNSYTNLDTNALKKIIDFAKDENGKIDRKKAHVAITLIKKTNGYRKSSEILATTGLFPFDKQKNIYETCINITPNERVAIANFSAIAEYCFDKNGDIKQDNLEFVKTLMQNNPIFYDEDFFNLCSEYPNLKEFFVEISSHTGGTYGFFPLTEIVKANAKEDGSLDEEFKNYILKYAKAKKSLNDFTNLYNACQKEIEGRKETSFDKKLFDKAITLFGYENQLCGKNRSKCIDSKTCVDIINGNLSVSNKNFKYKVNLLNTLKTIKDYVAKTDSCDFPYLDKAISDIDAGLNLENIGLPIEEEAKTDFIENVLCSKTKEGNYTEFENTLINSITKLEKMTNGIQIAYPRSKFLSDLSKICNSEDKLKILSEKVGITPILNENDDKDKIEITGYNGIIKLNELDKNNQTENEIYNCLHKFMYDNKACTGDKELDKQLNYIIKAFPEFINTIGKKQHGTQHYTVDVHSLLVLAYSIDNPDYIEKLTPLDRTLLKISTIFHDIMKQENVVDKGHQNLSSIYTKSIIKKIIKYPEVQDRIYEIIDNHHWTEEYSQAVDKDKKAMELAYRFRRPNDFEIAKIIARSDLKAVNEDFYERLKGCLEEDNLAPIQKNLDYIYSTGNVIFTDKIKHSADLSNCIQNKNGIEYKVINLSNIPDDYDMGEFGFEKGKKKEDLKFLIHMVDSHSIYNSLNTIKLLTSPLNGGVLSESVISPKYNRTYGNRKYGVLLSEINTNIVNASKNNQGSGRQKDLSNIIELIFKDFRVESRKYFKNELIKNLDIPLDGITDEEYAEFYKNILASKNTLLEINRSKTYKIGKYSFSGQQLVDAINKYQDDLIDKEEKHHNEIVGYTPKIHAIIAKEPSLDKVPEDLLKFAHENNLPIILL